MAKRLESYTDRELKDLLADTFKIHKEAVEKAEDTTLLPRDRWMWKKLQRASGQRMGRIQREFQRRYNARKITARVG
jgi:hypothetical protein